jgi:Concanavalin A-like lectin/glucanases superfamily
MPRRPVDDVDDDDDRPRVRRSRDDDYDRPARRPRPRKKPNLALWLGVGAGIFVLLLIGGVVVVWLVGNRVRDSARLPANGSTAAISIPGAIAHWTFDDAPQGRAPDAVGGVGDATLVECRLGVGIRGRSVEFDGNPKQYVDLGSSPSLSFRAGQDFTVAGWMRTLEAAGVVLSFRNSKSDRPQVELIVRNSRLLLVIGDDTDPGQSNAVVWSGVVNDNRWHHFAIGRERGEAVMYVDGQLQGRKGAAAVAGPITTDLRAVGCERLWATTGDNRWGPIGFRGAVDDLWVIGRALTPTEVLGLAAP